MEVKKLNVNEKQNTQYAIPLWLRDQQVYSAIKKVKRRIGDELPPGKPYPKRTEDIAIVGFAPSLNETWEELKRFKFIITCSGAHKFLLDKGFKPQDFERWLHLEVDPREHKIKLLGEPQKGIIYLPASTCHPKYFDFLIEHEVEVVLWHIFASEEEAMRTLPRGEWALTGGPSAGLRAMSMARFLGFTNLHIFGMDGSFGATGKHAAEHPNQPKGEYEVEYGGKKYYSTPSVLECARQTFSELDQMPDVKPTFYGEGLVQHMAKDYKPNYSGKGILGFNKPELISKEYIEQNKKLHEDNLAYGVGGGKHAETVLKMVEPFRKAGEFFNVLDYGCGKGYLARELPFVIAEYDPAIPGKDEAPKPAELVVCTDVLEHIEPDKLQFVLDDLKRCIKRIGYFVVSTRKAAKTYPNGQNTHLIVQGKEWWNKKLTRFFDVNAIEEKGKELHIIVSPKTKVEKPQEITTIEQDGFNVRIHTPTETTKWRADTLFTKEPATIEWIKGMEKDAIFFDVGANIGSYSILAGVKGLKVFAFEPESENHAMLVKNMELNSIDTNAYCIALSDKCKAGDLFINDGGAGQSCHSFGENLKPNLLPAAQRHKQGCLSMTLDEMVKMGLPAPDYLKIDVDGLEYNVIKGSEYILKNGLTSLLVEVNPEIEDHKKMVDYLCSIGFEFDEQQVEKAKRKSGAFKGVAEYVFTKKSKAKTISFHVERKVNDANLKINPFGHLYIENVFPKDIYEKILQDIKLVEYEEIEKTRGTRGYPKRFTGKTPLFLEELMNGNIKRAILNKFGIVDEGFTEDLLLIKDYEGYQIPPHTDALSKVISALFYLPDDDSIEGEGTSLYIPKQKGFTCQTGRHYNFDDFEKVWTAPFKPNSCLIFARTDNSFHGVEPSSHIRNVLLYNIKR